MSRNGIKSWPLIGRLTIIWVLLLANENYDAEHHAEDCSMSTRNNITKVSRQYHVVKVWFSTPLSRHVSQHFQARDSCDTRAPVTVAWRERDVSKLTMLMLSKNVPHYHRQLFGTFFSKNCWDSQTDKRHMIDIILSFVQIYISITDVTLRQVIEGSQ